MGRWRVARHGESAHAAARGALRVPPTGLCHGVPAGGGVLFLRIPSRGLAALVLPGRSAGAAGGLRAHAREGIGGVEEDPPRELGPVGPGHCGELETVSVYGRAHDGDEPGIARHAGHVPDFSGTPMGFHVAGRAGLTAFSMVGAIMGGTLFGFLSDRIGRRRSMVIALLAAVLAIPMWAFSPSVTLLVAGAFVMQFMAPASAAWPRRRLARKSLRARASARRSPSRHAGATAAKRWT